MRLDQGAGSRRWVLRIAARVGAGVAALAMASMSGCGGGGPDPTKAQVRFVNASGGYAALDVWVDDKRRFSSVTYGESAAYAGIDPQNAETTVTRAESTSPLLTLTPELKKDKHYTLLAFGGEGALQTVLLDENVGEPDSGKARIRVFNAAQDAGALDIYLTGSDEPIGTAVALRAGAELGKLTDFSTVDAGDKVSWRLRVTAAGDRADLRLDLSGLKLPSKGVTTLVVAPTAGGVLVHALLLVQEEGITRLDNTQARVRAAAPNSGVVSTAVGGVALLSGVSAPVVGPYQLVPAGLQAVTLAVDGTAVTVPEVTLAAGTDQTLLVYRQAGVPAAQWVSDDNRLPVASGQAKVRLVHGLDTAAGALALKVNYLPVGEEVTLAGASAYGSVTSTLIARITVTAAGDPAPLYDVGDLPLAAGGVYSVFVIEASAPNAGFVRRDR
jgi:hypothetical protein